VFACSLRSPGTISPAVQAEFTRTFPRFRALPCDVPLGDHPAQYNMIAKHARLASGGPNPFIDPVNCLVEADVQEAMYKATLAEQAAAK
jgi:metallo-beta-lactamase class B